MNRRAFVTGLGAVLAAPLGVEAQQISSKVARIGLFHVGLDHEPPALASLRDSLKRLGYEDGKTIQLDYRNQPDEQAARATARAFARNNVDLILAFEDQAVRAAQLATSKIPVVFAHIADPVAAGYVMSLARPGTNLTGVADNLLSLHDKRVQILAELQLRRVLVLIDPTDPTTLPRLADLTNAAPQIGVWLVERNATTEADLRGVFAALGKSEVESLVIISSSLSTKFPELILRLSLERRIPLASHRKALVEKGALFSYGPNYAAVGQDVAAYIDRILRGTKAAELPVQQASRFEFVINLKTAKALRLTIPPSLLLRADQVIE